MNETTNMKTILFSHHKSLDLHFYEEKNMNNFKRNDFLFLQKNYILYFVLKKKKRILYYLFLKKKKTCILSHFDFQGDRVLTETEKRRNKKLFVRKYENLSDYENLWIIIHIDVYLFVTPYKRKISLMKI